MPPFPKLSALLKKHAKNPLLTLVTTVPGSKQTDKPQLHIYSKAAVVIEKRPARQTFVVGIIQQKNQLGFYSLAMYTHPGQMGDLSPQLKKALKGKSCFYITDANLTPAMLAEIDAHIAKAIALYKKAGWLG